MYTSRSIVGVRMADMFDSITNVDKKILCKTKEMLKRISHQFKSPYLQEYYLFGTKCQLHRFIGSKAVRAKLVKERGRIVKHYALTISGEDMEHCLPDNTGRKFSITFKFESLLTKDRLEKLLTNAEKVSVVEGLKGDWDGLAIRKNDHDYIIRYTSPTEISHKYTRMEILDLVSVFCKDAQLVELPGGLHFPT